MPDPEYFGKLINPLIDKALGLPERDYGRPPSQLERELAQKERSEMAGVKNRAIEDNAKVVNDIRAEARIRGDWGDVPMEKQKQFLMARRALRGDDPMTGGEHPAENVLAPSPAAVALGVGGAADAPRSAQSSGAGPYQTGGRDFGSQGDLSWLQNFTPTEAHAIADVMRAQAGLGDQPSAADREINDLMEAAKFEKETYGVVSNDTRRRLEAKMASKFGGGRGGGGGGDLDVNEGMKRKLIGDAGDEAFNSSWMEDVGVGAMGVGRFLKDVVGMEKAPVRYGVAQDAQRLNDKISELRSQGFSDDDIAEHLAPKVRERGSMLLRHLSETNPALFRLLATAQESPPAVPVE